mmetsp:Transcript_47282/g.136598  ORF Transcript_47282/g.136598 Transcript_47282/m.136598 type:complete len:504 (+) Transcript_47282:851-2362(+)
MTAEASQMRRPKSLTAVVEHVTKTAAHFSSDISWSICQAGRSSGPTPAMARSSLLSGTKIRKTTSMARARPTVIQTPPCNAMRLLPGNKPWADDVSTGPRTSPAAVPTSTTLNTSVRTLGELSLARRVSPTSPGPSPSPAKARMSSISGKLCRLMAARQPKFPRMMQGQETRKTSFGHHSRVLSASRMPMIPPKGAAAMRSPELMPPSLSSSRAAAWASSCPSARMASCGRAPAPSEPFWATRMCAVDKITVMLILRRTISSVTHATRLFGGLFSANGLWSVSAWASKLCGPWAVADDGSSNDPGGHAREERQQGQRPKRIVATTSSTTKSGPTMTAKTSTWLKRTSGRPSVTTHLSSNSSVCSASSADSAAGAVASESSPADVCLPSWGLTFTTWPCSSASTLLPFLLSETVRTMRSFFSLVDWWCTFVLIVLPETPVFGLPLSWCKNTTSERGWSPRLLRSAGFNQSSTGLPSDRQLQRSTVASGACVPLPSLFWLLTLLA